MAGNDNLAVRILINARDNASSVFERLRDSWLTLAAAIGGGALFTSSVKEAADFEKAMDGVASKMGIVVEEGGEGAATMERLRAAAFEAGAATSFSAAQAADALTVLAAAGLSAKQQISALTPVLNIAAIEGLELAEAAGIITATINQMGMSFEDSGRVADVLDKAAGMTDTTIAQMGEAFKNSAVDAARFGLSLEDLSAAYDVLAKNGLQGAEAGTALKNVLAQVNKESSPVRTELEKLGIASKDLGEVFDGIAAAGDRGNKALDAFGEFSGAASAFAKEGSEGLNTFRSAFDAATGQSARSAKIATDNFHGMIDALKSAISGAKIAFATPLLEPLTAQVQKLSEKVQTFTKSDAFKALSAGMVSSFNAMVAAAEEFLSAVDWESLGARIAEFSRHAKTYLDAFFNNTRAIGTAVGAVGDGISVVWHGIAGAILAVVHAISNVATGAVEIYARLTAGLNSVGRASDQTAADARALADSMHKSTEELRKSALNNLGQAGESAVRLGNTLLATGQQAVEAGKNILQAGKDAETASDQIAEAFAADTARAIEILATRAREYTEAMAQAAAGDEHAAAKAEVLRMAMEDAQKAVATAKQNAADYEAQQKALATAQERVAEAEKAYAEAVKLASNATAKNAEEAANAAAQLPDLKQAVTDAKNALAEMEGQSGPTGAGLRRLADDTRQTADTLTPATEQMRRALVGLREDYARLIAAGDAHGAAQLLVQIQAIESQLRTTGASVGSATKNLDQYREAVDRAQAEVTRLTEAEAAGQRAAKELAPVQDQQRRNLEQLNDARAQSLPAMARLAAENNQLAAREKALTAQVDAGQQASTALVAARKTAGTATAQLSSAIYKLRTQKELELVATERQIAAVQEEGDLRAQGLRHLADEKERRAAIAKTLGDEETARRLNREAVALTVAALRCEADTIDSLVDVKNAELTQLKALLEAKRQELALRGGGDTEAQVEIDRTQATIDAKSREVEGYQQSAKSKRDEADATADAADANDEAAKSADTVTEANDAVADSFGAGAEAAANFGRVMISEAVASLRTYSESAADAVDSVIGGLDSWYNKLYDLNQLASNPALFDTSPMAESAREIVALETAAQAAADKIQAMKEHLLFWPHDILRGATEAVIAIKGIEVQAIQVKIEALKTAQAIETLGDAFDDLSDQFDAGDLGLSDYIAQLESLRRQYSYLTDDELDSLTDALESAKEEQQDLIDTAVDGLNDWKSKLLELQGQHRAVEEMNWQQDRLETELELAEARRNGNAEEIAALQKQLTLIDQYYEIKVAEAEQSEAEARAEKAAAQAEKNQAAAETAEAKRQQAEAQQAEAEADAEASESQAEPRAAASVTPAVIPVRTVNINLRDSSGQTATVRVLEGDEDALERILRLLEAGRSVT